MIPERLRKFKYRFSSVPAPMRQVSLDLEMAKREFSSRKKNATSREEHDALVKEASVQLVSYLAAKFGGDTVEGQLDAARGFRLAAELIVSDESKKRIWTPVAVVYVKTAHELEERAKKGNITI